MAAPQESESITVFYGPNVRVVTSTEVIKAKQCPVTSAAPQSEAMRARMSTDLRSGQISVARTTPPAQKP
ncbi:hypothetical protein A2153_02435 [Candidatus Gottesmanbacteria bacterium RBG_16_38_7b]|uniref:Uncharacterized protein n=1 Tax=Candidatus Gottesmanbacteria bacterium RBG_16_38_7b TaxID=1798372 RepID=A0A1F5YKG7_9BACT|nr:MAG: hypothetical protein A2153_02435 [Candidatus Gottesmanbacteria bacterium RBG_16_38_7b]